MDVARFYVTEMMTGSVSQAGAEAAAVSGGDLLAAGAEISVYQPTMLHTKMLIVDRQMVSVGSTNFDVRSFELNDEASLNLYDADFAEAMAGVFEQDWAEGEPYTYEMWASRPWTERFAETVLLPLKSQL